MDQNKPSHAGDPQTQADDQAVTEKAGYSRFAAFFVLLVATPLLLLTGLALGLFFVAPERFNDFLAKLPGEAAIRTVMIFAPAALIAIIVLAVLYAAEPKLEGAPQTQPFVPIEEKTFEVRRFITANRAGWFLALAVPVLLLLIAVRSAGFLSPNQFDHFIQRLPGTPVIDFIIGGGFPILSILVILALPIFFEDQARTSSEDQEIMSRARQWMKESGPARLGVGTVLLFSIPLLILSLLALTGFLARPSRVLDVLTQLPKEVIVRLGLLFGPSSLFIVVVLAMLFLIRRSVEAGQLVDPASRFANLSQTIYDAGSWLLLAGLMVASASVFGLAVGMIVLFLR
jgi:hypothetical protein